MFVARRHFGYVDKAQHRHVVFKHSRSNKALFDVIQAQLGTNFLEEDAKREKLAHCQAEGNVFGGCRTECDVSLQFAGPQNGTPKESENEPSLRFD